MLQARGLKKTFYPGTVNARVALNNLSLTLEDGDFAAVIGGNGAGKSTLLNAVAGEIIVDEGTISVAGRDVTRTPTHRRADLVSRVCPGSAGRQRRQHDHRGKPGPGDTPGPVPTRLRFALSDERRRLFRDLLSIFRDWGSRSRLSHKVELLSERPASVAGPGDGDHHGAQNHPARRALRRTGPQDRLLP